MQPQAAAHVAATCQGDVPLAGMAELFIEVAPGNEIFRVADIALKAADVRPALQIVEREFGLLEIHSEQQAEVLAAGAGGARRTSGLTEADRVKPKIASAQFVTNVHPYQAQLLNKWRKGSLLIARAEPVRARGRAGRLRRRSPPTRPRRPPTSPSIEMRAVGRFGRVFLSGTESDVQTARGRRPSPRWRTWRAGGPRVTVSESRAVETGRRARDVVAPGEPATVVTPLARDGRDELGVDDPGRRPGHRPAAAHRAAPSLRPAARATVGRAAGRSPPSSASCRPPGRRRPVRRRCWPAVPAARPCRPAPAGRSSSAPGTSARSRRCGWPRPTCSTRSSLVDVVPGLAAGLALDLVAQRGARRVRHRGCAGTDDVDGTAGAATTWSITAGRPRSPG